MSEICEISDRTYGSWNMHPSKLQNPSDIIFEQVMNVGGNTLLFEGNYSG
jgi:hypothetical protein